MKNTIARFHFVLLAFALALLAGCASSDSSKTTTQSTTTTTTTTTNPRVTDPTHVVILFKRPKAAYTELNGVSSPKSGSWQHELQKQAASQGADAVIVDTSTLNNINSTFVSGTAIRYQ